MLLMEVQKTVQLLGSCRKLSLASLLLVKPLPGVQLGGNQAQRLLAMSKLALLAAPSHPPGSSADGALGSEADGGPSPQKAAALLVRDQRLVLLAIQVGEFCTDNLGFWRLSFGRSKV